MALIGCEFGALPDEGQTFELNAVIRYYHDGVVMDFDMGSADRSLSASERAQLEYCMLRLFKGHRHLGYFDKPNAFDPANRTYRIAKRLDHQDG